MKGFIIAVSIFVCLFLVFIGVRSLMDDRSDKVKIVHKITGETAKEIYKKLDLRCVGTGGQMMYEIKSLFMAFKSSVPFEIDQARNLLVQCVQIYLKNINASKKIQPYLSNYPFENKNIRISIHCPVDGNGLEHLFYVTIRNGTISYQKDRGREIPSETIHEETYEEALKILESQKP